MVVHVDLSFNPRSRVGSDLTGQDKKWKFKLFQSTLPRGERHDKSGTQHVHSIVSIHAPAWGATITIFFKKENKHVSIHAPAWGATVFFKLQTVVKIVSIHAPAWGATADIG